MSVRAASRISLSIDSIERVDEDLSQRIREAALDVRLDCVREINRLVERIDADGPPLSRAEVIAMLVELWGAIMDGEHPPPPDWVPR